MTTLSTPATAWCPNCGETHLTAAGKCTRCGSNAVKAATTEALSNGSHPVVIRRLETVSPQPQPQPVELPPTAASRRWIAQTDALLEGLERERVSIKQDLAAQQARLEQLDKAIDAIKATRGALQVQPTPVRQPALPSPGPGAWSTKYERCIDCGTTEIKHASKGRCRSCDSRLRSAKAHQ